MLATCGPLARSFVFLSYFPKSCSLRILEFLFMIPREFLRRVPLSSQITTNFWKNVKYQGFRLGQSLPTSNYCWIVFTCFQVYFTQLAPRVEREPDYWYSDYEIWSRWSKLKAQWIRSRILPSPKYFGKHYTCFNGNVTEVELRVKRELNNGIQVLWLGINNRGLRSAKCGPYILRISSARRVWLTRT